MADFTGVTLDDLNNYTKADPTGIIVPDTMVDWPLLDALRPNLNTQEFTAGTNVEILIEATRGYTGQAFWENADLPYPLDTSFVKQLIPLRELMVTAGLTKQALDKAIGGTRSWGRAVDVVMRQREEDWNWLLNDVIFGVGNGEKARVVSAAADGATTVLTCDNTYYDFGRENVQHLKVGERVEVIDVSDTPDACETDTAGNSSWTVTAVSFGDRNNGAATTGTVTLGASTGLAAKLQDNDVVCRVGGLSSALTQPFPQGLMAFCQGNGDHYSGYAALTTFQNLTRSSYDSLKGRVYNADAFASGGVANTPDDWDLSVISDCFMDVSRGSGRGKVDLLLCSMPLAAAISRLSKSENSMQVFVNTTSGLSQAAAGSTIAPTFIAPDGRHVPIKVVETIPENVLYGITTDDLIWHVFGAFENLGPRLGANGAWMKSPADRKTNFEAPFGGYMQLTARRCDNMFCLMDLKSNV